jgi:hypothetical protein
VTIFCASEFSPLLTDRRAVMVKPPKAKKNSRRDFMMIVRGKAQAFPNG